MPKPRLPENKSLPARWTYHHGAYYYLVPKGLEPHWNNKTKFKLGKTLPEAFSVFGSRIEQRGKIRTINQLLDRYVLEVVPKKAAASQASNLQQIKKLRIVFGHMPILPFPPRYVYQYVDKRSSKTSAHREIDTLSHAYTKLVEWGEIDRHPFKGEVRLEGEKPRDRYVEDWEITECLNLSTKSTKSGVAVIQAYIKLKLLTGMARGDLLRLEPEKHFKDDGIHVNRHKTKNSTNKKTVYEWTPALKAAVEEAKNARPSNKSLFLFCNKNGQGYINEKTGSPPGFKSLWQRFFKRLLAETKVTQHFTEHDLRAKVASDANNLEYAKDLLSHSDSGITDRIYRRKATYVKPLK